MSFLTLFTFYHILLFVYLHFFNTSYYICIWLHYSLLPYNLDLISDIILYFYFLSLINDFFPVFSLYLPIFVFNVWSFSSFWKSIATCFWGYFIKFGVVALSFFFLFEGRKLGEGILIAWNTLIFIFWILLIVDLCGRGLLIGAYVHAFCGQGFHL